MDKENVLLENKHILVCDNKETYVLDEHNIKELEYVKSNFCGIVVSDIETFDEYVCFPDTIIYMCGNVEQNYPYLCTKENQPICVIKEFSTNFSTDTDKYKIITVGETPINVNGVGVYFRNLFDCNKDYFDLINGEHEFQSLTESNKPSNAFRTGIYLTKVEELDDEIKFKLLRCSSNLNGPTDNFRTTDNEVVNRVNFISEYFFEQKADLNHVLAQIYENKIMITDTKKTEKKASIKEHSDKTKDMARSSLMAFCTFYKKYSNNKFNDDGLTHIKKSKDDYFDWCHNDQSVLTRIRFRLKKMISDSRLKKEFDVVLYPNSVFVMSLSMNRLYTHEIIPSVLPIDKIPTRMGYVIRCSKTNAIYKNDQTYIEEDGTYVKMEEPDVAGVKNLRELYFKENTTDEMMYYDKFRFSMNSGDYKKPYA